MNVKSLAAAALVFGGLLASGSLLAHHSNAAMYDADKRTVLKGQITKVQWTNPHSYLYLDVKGPNGEVVNWALEGFPPNTLLRTGWKTSMIKVGDEISVEGALARDGSGHLLAREITLPDASKLYWGPER
ncbi:MAG: hypothetical protein LBE59_08630 [Nevskiaceae bacterium]|nr:hypothetical protein [Nevskiaceae bacterium]